MIVGLFDACLESASSVVLSLMLLTQQAVHRFGGSTMCVPIVFQNACKQLHGEWFFCFQGQVSSLSPHFHLFCLLMDVASIWLLEQRSHHF
jgi:hypothetical protein